MSGVTLADAATARSMTDGAGFGRRACDLRVIPSEPATEESQGRYIGRIFATTQPKQE
jgi:hypothetical protein